MNNKNLKHYCMWCTCGRVDGDEEGVVVCCNIKDKHVNFTLVLDGGLSASAESISNCQSFDWDFTRPGAEWAKAFMESKC